MSHLPLKKLLSEYFQKPDLQNACRKIDEPTSYTNPELEKIISREWERHGNNKYDLFALLDRPTLSRICDAYSLDHTGSKQVLLKRIKKEKLLDDSKKSIKITSGVGVGIFLFILALYGAGVDTFGLVTYFTTSPVENELPLEITDQELGELLKSGNVEEFNKIKRDWVGKINFDGINLSKMDLTLVDLRYTSLRNADFDYTNLTTAFFNGADLEQASFRNANFERANLVEANLNKAFLRGANFEQANLNRASMQNADLYGANLRQATLIKTDLQNADLQHAEFLWANLEDANLDGAILNNTDFREVQNLPISLEESKERNAIVD